MKACLCKTYGKPSDLVVETLPDPRPQKGEVIVRVKACGLNFFDTLIIEGKYQYKPEMPFSPSAEFAGIIEAIGPDVTGVNIGDRVMGYTGYGAARELLVIAKDDVIRIPDNTSFEAAAGLAVTYGTTLHALKDRADLQAGETIAVLGASGGVGQAAVEIAKLMGARVIACASSEEKLEFTRKLGADVCVNYSKEPLKETLKELTQGAGVNVVYDPVGGDLAEQAVRATGWEGRYLVIGFAAGQIPKIPLNLVMLKGSDIRGVFWGASIAKDPQRHRENMRQLLAWVDEGKLRPHIHAVYPLARLPEALMEISERKVLGKVIVTP